MKSDQQESTATTTSQPPVVTVGELVDITDLVTDVATNHLNTSTTPFIANPLTFHLNDAMSATQLMDPIMDCCQLPAHHVAPWNDPHTITYPRPLPTSLHDPMTPLPWHNLTLASVRWVAVQALVRLQSFLCGSSAGDSVFTCLYAHCGVLNDMMVHLVGEPPQKEQVTLVQAMERMKIQNDNEDNDDETLCAQWSLFACIVYIVELTDNIRSAVEKADIYEEENFVVQTYSLRFFSLENPQTDLPVILARALGLLKKRQPADENARILTLILEYQSCFFRACVGLEQLSIANRLQNITRAQVSVEKALARLDLLTELVGKEDREDTPEEKAFMQRCFDPFIARQLVGNFPIRKTSFVSPQESFSILRDITAQLDYGVCQFHLRGGANTTSLSRIHRLLRPFSAYNILVRSLVVLTLYYEDHLLGVHAMSRLIANHIKQHCYHNEPPSLATNEHAIAFYGRLGKPIYDVLKLSLLNETRQRGLLEATILPDWSLLQNEAKIADVQCSTPHHCFYYYVLVHTVQLMERYLVTGLQTGLFHLMPTDLAFCFWYRDCLLAVRHQHLTTMYQSKEALAMIERQEQQQNTTPKNDSHKSGKGKKKNQSSKKVNKQKQKQQQQTALVRTAEDQEDTFALQILALKRNLCRKTIQFVAALRQAGVLNAEEEQYEFTSLATIFAKRFEPFHMIEQPPLQPYGHFQEGTDFSSYTAEQLQLFVHEGYQSCRSSIEVLLVELGDRETDERNYYGDTCQEELKALRKVCVGNGVYLQKLRQNESVGLLQASFDFDTHAEFCIIKLTNKN